MSLSGSCVMSSVLEISRSAPIVRCRVLGKSSAWRVNRTTLVRGMVVFSNAAAIAPLSSGMEKSMTMMSGWSSFASSMASTPFAASPQTQPGPRLDHVAEERTNIAVIVSDQDTWH